MTTVPWRTAEQFAELYVISDLHLGGCDDFQIFHQGELLAEFIDRLRTRRVDGTLALVINGDTVDFLAEQEPKYFDPEGAGEKLDRIVGDVSFKPVFTALRRFTATKGRRLIVTLGNHDLELALPWMRERLLSHLTSDDAGRGRVTLAFDGAGYVAQVGSAPVYCVHGNDVDEWNFTEYDKLRRQGLGTMLGETVPEWTPNAGTKLVVDVMNSIKARFPFVDLLKPETEAVVPTLCALDPSLKSKLGGVLKVAARRAWDELRMFTGFLSADQEAERRGGRELSPEAAVDTLLARSFGTGSARELERSTAEVLLANARLAIENDDQPAEALPQGRSDAHLGIVSGIWDVITRKSKVEVLREFLEKLEHDQSFLLTTPDTTFQRTNALVKENAIVVTGHTHMERALPRGGQRGIYFNSGTWVRLMQFTPAQLANEVSFTPVYEAIAAGKMASLAPYIMSRPCAVRIRLVENQTEACLLRPEAGLADLGVVVPGSRFVY